MNLIDTLKQNAEKLRLGSNEAALQRLAVAKQGLSAQPEGSGPRKEQSLIEQQTQRDIVNQEKELVGASQQLETDKQLKKQELNQALDITRKQNQEKALNIRQDFQNKADAILRSRSEQRDQLSLDRDRAKAEQAAFLMRLSDDKYITNLKTEGAKERLDNEIRFREEAMKAALGNASELYNNNFTFRKLMTAKDNEFDKVLNSMKIDDAITLLNTQLGYQELESLEQLKQTNPSEAASIASMIQGGMGLAKAGYGAYQAYTSPAAARQELLQAGYSPAFLNNLSDDDIIASKDDLLNPKL